MIPATREVTTTSAATTPSRQARGHRAEGHGYGYGLVPFAAIPLDPAAWAAMDHGDGETGPWRIRPIGASRWHGQERKLTGGSRYELHFRAGGMPPADAFWSLTMYGSDLNLVANPIGRYSIRDTTAGLNKDPDGGLTIYLQAESPRQDKEANWLPGPADGEWFVILRLYHPRPEVIQAEWECPPIERMD